MLVLLRVLPLASAFLPAGRGISRDLAMMARKKNNTGPIQPSRAPPRPMTSLAQQNSTRGISLRSSDIKASFDDYLREVRLPVAQFDSMSLEKQKVERGRYIKWLELRSQPTTAPGNDHPRLLSASMLNFESSTLHCLILALTAFVCLQLMDLCCSCS